MFPRLVLDPASSVFIDLPFGEISTTQFGTFIITHPYSSVKGFGDIPVNLVPALPSTGYCFVLQFLLVCPAKGETRSLRNRA
jgi:hypothetical protein